MTERPNPALIAWHVSMTVFGVILTALVIPALTGIGAIVAGLIAARSHRDKVRRDRYSWAVDAKHTNRSAYKRARYGCGYR